MNLRTFKKGVRPSEFKEFTDGKSIEILPLPDEVFIPVQQHIGAPCKPVVEKGMDIKTGQIIATAGGFVSSLIHATISGKVKAIESFPHPLSGQGLMIQIISDGKDEWINTGENVPKVREWEKLSKDEIITDVQNAGIVGMGGAAFPLHVKLSPPKGKTIDTLILNGCECEPFLTADHRMMLEKTDDVILGVRLIMKALGAEKAIIGIEANKPDAIEKITKAIAPFPNITVQPLKVKYPQGAEKMLIKAALNRNVPAGGLPMDVNVVVNNVGTAIAVTDAVMRKRPVIERVVTVTGKGIREPKNVLARIGTPFQNLIDFCGGLTEDAAKVLMGGPMMGVAQHTLAVPVIKATSGIVCLTSESIVDKKEYPCIQCGACIRVCPMDLMPTRLARFAQNCKWDEAEKFGIVNCIECGSCAFVCPSNIPLVQRIRIGKLKVNEIRRKQKTVEKVESN